MSLQRNRFAWPSKNTASLAPSHGGLSHHFIEAMRVFVRGGKEA